ncbi:amidophosphoribosyltransferase [Actinomyces sp. zg-332]|uniref:amidophosphoribosyltransferase n=1 Tax=Actinomyces sp. zg-332 TaxID=2708340 RepID=UPI00141EBF70|nr:amidophosphoribosyltransferase [Actinomyces sp. zg-332]QPK93751.1 amidophosphoribosyltransferase [Actinomyces sp. zg-332]
MLISEDDNLHEECGVFAIYAPGQDVSRLTYYGLFALQHRGQEGCGIAVSDEEGIKHYKGLGLVTEVFSERELDTLKGHAAIGHVRYSTTGCNSLTNTQPIVANYNLGEIALAHNGNLANTENLRKYLTKKGSVFHTSVDTEVVVHMLAQYTDLPLEQAFVKSMGDIKGSYAFVALNKNKLYAARDPYGNRPLCLGKYKNGYVVASESCALSTIDATFIRDIEAGEVLVIDETGVTSFMTEIDPKPQKAHCIFEYVYFARPDSNLDGINVNLSRRRMGEILADELEKLDVDIVIPVPDSGTTAAIGFASVQDIKFTQGILKNRYAGRTFIQPTQEMRELMVNLKLNPIRDEIEGKRVAVVDDSIVRGTTSKRLIERLRQRGAKEVHMLITCPPVKYPCFYGIDTGNRDTLIAATKSTEEIREYIGADSLNYLSLPGLLKAVGNKENFCTACLDGRYRMGVPSDYEAEK